jgi:hypothetical protein
VRRPWQDGRGPEGRRPAHFDDRGAAFVHEYLRRDISSNSPATREYVTDCYHYWSPLPSVYTSFFVLINSSAILLVARPVAAEIYLEIEHEAGEPLAAWV